MSLINTINAAAKKLPETQVTVKLWDKKVTLRRLSLAERTSLFERLSGENNKTNVASLLVAYSLVDESGEKLHTQTPVDEIYQSLEAGEASVVELLYKKADKLSAVTPEAVEEIEKN